jgi:signal peptidase I
MGLFVGVLVGVFLVNLAVYALLLWLSCRLVGARRAVASGGGAPALLVPVGYWRSLISVVLVALVNLALTALLAFAGLLTSESLPALLLGPALAFSLYGACVWLVLRLPLGKAVLVALLSSVLSGAYAFGCVLALKLWLAEAFVVPTGAMANTLLGYHKHVKCPSCGHEFDINASREADPGPDREAVPTNGCTCPNCRQLIRLVDSKRDEREPQSGESAEYREIADPAVLSGDRFLMVKGPLFKRPSERFDLIAFLFPEGPELRYIKRLVGLPGETIAILRGKLYRLAPEDSLTYSDDAASEDLRKLPYAHPNDAKARALFTAGKFQILRKPPETLLTLMHLVYDNDLQADDLKGKDWQRWLPEDNWKTDDNTTFQHNGGPDKVSWLHYRHLLRQHPGQPSLITDFMGYNSSESLRWDSLAKRWEGPPSEANGVNWVGDLILECEVQVEEAQGELVLQLVRGQDRFQATWDLSSDKGMCTLTRITRRAGARGMEDLDSRPTRLGKGKHQVRFANVDDRLTVWVDGELPFGDGAAYSVLHPEDIVPTEADLRPAGIGVKGGSLSVRHLKLFRDTYHTLRPNTPDVRDFSTFTRPADWDDIKDMPVLTLYVQPGHYLCLGDNSLASSDSRTWGMVPERLLLGKAMLVYYPFARVRRLR